jgi:pantoate--beta-alanine ligase
MSSRNRYLSPENRARARAIPLALDRAVASFARGERNVERLRAVALDAVASEVDSVDYVTLADSQSIEPLQGEVQERALLALAVRLGGARLIDNVVLGEEGSPLRGVS